MLAQPEPEPNDHARRAIGRFALATIGWMTIGVLPYAPVLGVNTLVAIFFSPLALFTLPVNPQGRSDYYLTTAIVD